MLCCCRYYCWCCPSCRRVAAEYWIQVLIAMTCVCGLFDADFDDDWSSSPSWSVPAETLHHTLTWNFDPVTVTFWPLTVNICSRSASPQSNSLRNLSEMWQSAAELLHFECLTLWPWTRITFCAMLRDSLHNLNTVKLSVQAIRSWNVTICFVLIRHVKLWPWPLTCCHWKFVVYECGQNGGK